MPSDTNTTENPFLTFWEMGFKRLVPVVPPNAPVHEYSRLAARVRAGKDPRGKVPGVRNNDGNWHGIDFTKCEAIRQDLDRWNAMGASIGIKTGRGIIAVDIDTVNPTAAKKIYDAALDMLGPAKVRIGRKPKCLLIYKAPDDIGYSRVKFSTETEDSAAVEILAEGRQFIAHGIHPSTAKPYAWPYGIPAAADLTQITKDQLNAFLAHIAAVMTQAIRQDASADREAPDQETLLAPDWETLKTTVEAMPNAQIMFPTREDYVKVAYAIKGAAPQGYETEALELYLDWCDRWDGGTNDQDEALRDWQRAKPPYRVGYPYLQQNAVGLYFQPAGSDALENMFSNVETAQAAQGEVYKKRSIQLLSDEDFDGRPSPTWLIDRHIPDTGFGILYGDPGSGKSFMALDMALHVAARKADWNGDEINTHLEKGGNTGAVLYIAGEGAGGMTQRLKAWRHIHHEHGFIPKDRFRVIIEPINFLNHEDVERLLQAVRDADFGKLSLIIVDTVSRSIPGADENKQQDMTIFISACDKLKIQTGAFVLGVHHTAKSGQMRGSSVFEGQSDAVFKFEREKGAAIGYLHCAKMKDSEAYWRDAYQLDKIDLGLDMNGKPASSLVPRRVESPDTAAAASCTPEMQESMLADIGRAWDAGQPLSTDKRAKDADGNSRYAPLVLGATYCLSAAVVEQVIGLLLAIDPVDGRASRLEVAVVNPKTKRTGLRVTGVSGSGVEGGRGDNTYSQDASEVRGVFG